MTDTVGWLLTGSASLPVVGVSTFARVGRAELIMSVCSASDGVTLGVSDLAIKVG